MAYPRMRTWPRMLFFTRNTVAIQVLGLRLGIIFHSCQMCVVFWGCGQNSTGTWLRPADIFLPAKANNRGINLLCHLALNISTTEGQTSVAHLKLKLEYCHLLFRL